MNKREYKKIFKQCFDNIPLEKIYSEILRAKRVLTEYENEITRKIDKKYYKCYKCNKYYPKKEWKTENTTKTKYGVTVYIDCGYGDYDQIADVTYNIKYRICPKCGKKHCIDKIKISESNRRDRRQ